ncbi:SIS domain-containing protein [Arthrobacter sedimenti]|uniref:SIS domain-containing protein n=1 Tax=Arthrobacter sedimenti TaxID=2694931 RepID=UPI000B34CE1C|nr:SIS domain-containing protein [Arthrobacter sedimenti]OUM43473.1 hypothetical protein B8W73_06165 [Arthrobacter agilis]
MSNSVPFITAMLAQPETLASAHSGLNQQLRDAKMPAWKPEETVAVVAMGASHYSGIAFTALMSAAGYRSVNLVASELAPIPAGYQPADHYLIISESGRSPEPINAALSFTTGRRIVISNFPEAPIRAVADVSLGLGGFDDSLVYTAGYTATLLAYGLLMETAGIPRAGAGLDEIPRTVREALIDYDDVTRAAGAKIAGASAVDVIGQGPSFAAAAETALMLREGLRIPAAAFETLQYLHGPMESADANSALIIFGDDRELTVPDSVLDTGTKVILVTSRTPNQIPSLAHPNLTVINIDPDLTGFARCIIEALVGQMIVARGIGHKPFEIEDFLYDHNDTKISLEDSRQG